MAAGHECTPLSKLAQRDQLTFKLAQKLLEEGKCPKAAKIVDILLGKYPACIELLAVKCLIYRKIPEKKEDALTSIKVALKLDMKSVLAWYTMGNYYQLEGDYNQALISYKQAVKCDPTNFQVYKEISLVQLFLRQYDAFLETRKFMLAISNDSKINWCAVPLALHLNSQPLQAAELLLQWWSIPQEVVGNSSPRWETELRLYLVTLFEEAGEFERAYHHVSSALEYDKQLCDPLNALSLKGRLALRLEKYGEAKDTYEELIKVMPENTDFLLGYFWSHPQFHELSFIPNLFEESLEILCPLSLSRRGVANPNWTTYPLLPLLRKGLGERVETLSFLDRWGRGLRIDCDRRVSRKMQWNRGALWQLLYQGTEIENGTTDTSLEGELCAVFDSLNETLGRSYDTVSGFPLCLLKDPNRIYERTMKLLKPKLVDKCASAANAMVDNLLQTSSRKQKVILKVVDDIYSSLIEKKCDKLARSSIPLAINMVKGVQAFSLLNFAPSKFNEGFELLKQSLMEVPTSSAALDLNVAVLEDLGLYEKAAHYATMNYKMDTADRYLNDRCVTALLRNDDLDLAVKTAKEFNKATPGKEKTDPVDLQNYQYEFEIIRAMYRLRMFEECSKRLDFIISRYSTILRESQDFYYYCMRRGTYRSFVQFLRMNEKLMTHRDYMKALIMLVDLYVDKGDGLLPDEDKSNCKKFEHLKAEPWPMRRECSGLNHAEDPLSEAAALLATVTYEGFAGNYQFNQRIYLLHHRDHEKSKPSKALSALRNLWHLCDEKLFHPKLFPYILHFLSREKNGGTGDESQDPNKQFLLGIIDEKYRKNPQEYFKEGIRLHMEESLVLKDRLSVFKALALMAWSDSKAKQDISFWKEEWNNASRLLRTTGIKGEAYETNYIAEILKIKQRFLREERRFRTVGENGLSENWELESIFNDILDGAYKYGGIIRTNDGSLDELTASLSHLAVS